MKINQYNDTILDLYHHTFVKTDTTYNNNNGAYGWEVLALAVI